MDFDDRDAKLSNEDLKSKDSLDRFKKPVGTFNMMQKRKKSRV